MRAFLVLALMAAVHGQTITYDQTSLTVNDVSVTEGDSVAMTFTAVFHHAVVGEPQLFTTARVLWTTVPPSLPVQVGVATPNVDYVAVNNGVFELMDDRDGTTATFAVQLKNDDVQEGTERFTVQLYFATNAAWENIRLPNNGQAIGSIADDEGLTVMIEDNAALEGSDTRFSFTVSISHVVDTGFPVQFKTLERELDWYGNSVVGPQQDYAATSGELVFFSSNSDTGKKKVFNVAIQNDDLQERVETFEVELTYQIPNTNAQFRQHSFSGGKFARATFKKEFEGVTVCVAQVKIAEGPPDLGFTVALSHRVDTAVIVTAKTAMGNNVSPKIAATVGTHYLDQQGTTTFSKNTPNIQDTSFVVSVMNDDVQSPNSNPYDQDTFGQTNFKVQYQIGSNVWGGSTGGAANDWQVTACGQPTEQTGTSYGFIYDFEDVTMYIADAGTHAETLTDAAWTFSVHLSHKVIAKDLARGAQYTFVDLNSASSTNNFVAKVDPVTPLTGCTNLPIGTPSYDTVDVCWPVGTVPESTTVGGLAYPPTTMTFEGINSLNPATKSESVFGKGPSDAVLEGTETFSIAVKLMATTANGYRVTLKTDASIGTGTILDDETAAFYYTPNTGLSLPEDSTVGGRFFVYSVQLSHTPGKEVSVDWETKDGTATTDVIKPDYERKFKTTMPFPPGTAPDTPQMASVKILNDDIQEESETFYFVFSNLMPTGIFGRDHPPKSYMATITDQEGLTVSINSMLTAQDESAPDWFFTAELSHQVSVDVSIDWNTEQSLSTNILRAEEGVRYHFQSGSVAYTADPQGRFPKGTAKVSIQVIDDNIQMYNVDTTVQTFKIALKTGAVQLISQTDQTVATSIAEVRVKDDEAPTIFITSVTDAETKEFFSFSVFLSHQISTDVTIPFTTNDGTAVTSGAQRDGKSDYVTKTTSLQIQKYTPAFGMPLSGTELRIAINNDDVQEFSEMFTVDLDAAPSLPVGSGYVVAVPQGVGMITDLEDMSVEILSMEGYEKSFPATGSANNEVWSFTVKLSHRTSTALNMSFSLQGHTAQFGPSATAGTQAYDFTQTCCTAYDFTNPCCSKVGQFLVGGEDVASGDLPTMGYLNVTIVDDQIAEETETFIVRLGRVISPNFSVKFLADKRDAIGTITDFEDATVSISGKGPQPKSQPIMTFDVHLSHRTSKDSIVTYNTVADSATAWVNGHGDYIEQSSAVTFMGSNEGTAYVSVPEQLDITITRDFCQEMGSAKETFFVQLNSVPAHLALASPSNSKGAGVVFELNAPTLHVADSTSNEGTDMLFTVTLSHCIATDIVVNWDVADGTAIGGTDYDVPVSGLAVTFPADNILTVPMTKTFPVTINNDDIQSVDKNFTTKIAIMGASANYGITMNRDTAVGLIMDDEKATVSVSQCIAESGKLSPFIFSVTLSHLVDTDLEILYQTQDVTAVSGGNLTLREPDYTSTSGNLTFRQHANGLTVASQLRTVPVEVFDKNDTLRPHIGFRNASVRFNFSLSSLDVPLWDSRKMQFSDFNNNNGKGAILGKNSTKITVARVEASESASFVFTAILEDEINVDMDIEYRPEPGSSPSAQAGIDFDGTPGLLSFKKFMGKNQIKTFTVVVTDDWLQERHEKFNTPLSVKTPPQLQQYIDFTGVSSDHLIKDNDHSTVLVGSPSAEEAADGTVLSNPTAPMVFPVTLSHYIYTEVRIQLKAEGGSALVYNGASPPLKDDLLDVWFNTVATPESWVTFPGQPDFKWEPDGSTVNFLDVLILNDDVQEPTETLTLTCTRFSPVGVLNFGPSEVPPGIGSIPDFENGNMTIGHAEAKEGSPMTFTVTLSHKVTPSVDFEWETIDGTAKRDLNYNYTTGLISFTKTTPSQQITVDTVDNLILQGNTTFMIKIITQTPVQNVDTSTNGIGLILSDAENVKVTVSSPTLQEFAGSQAKFVLRLNTAVDKEVVVGYSTRDGTARSNQVPTPDYITKTGTVTFLGSTQGEEQIVTVDVSDDNIQERDEEFYLDLNLVSPIGYPIGFDPAFGTATIQDNEFPTLSVRKAQVEEFVGASMRFTVYLSHALEKTLDITYQTEDGTADSIVSNPNLDWIDYVSAQGSITRVAEAMLGPSLIIIPVFITDDFVVENMETFGLRLTQVTPPIVPLDPVLSYNVGKISDNERATISVASKDVLETIGTFDLEIHMSHAAQPTITVSVSSYDGYANSVQDAPSLRNLDYTALPLHDMSFESVRTTPETIFQKVIHQPIEIHDDHVQETLEDFGVYIQEIKTPVNGLTASNPDGNINIVNDTEYPTIRILDARNDEGTGVQMLIFQTRMSHGVQVSNIALDFETRDSGSAIAGKDYTATAGRVEFPRSVADNFVTPISPIEVAVLPDNIEEELETFEVHLLKVLGIPFCPSVCPGAGYTELANHTVSIAADGGVGVGTIDTLNNTGEVATISIESSEANEDAGNMVFTVHLSHEIAKELAIEWDTLDDSASAPQDYTTTKGSVIFAGGEQLTGMSVKKMLSVEIKDDFIVQPTQSFKVVLTPNTGSRVRITTDTGYGSILDNDDAIASIADGSAVEGGEHGVTESVSMKFAATMTHKVQGKVDFSWSTMDDTALSGEDFTKVTDENAGFELDEVATTLEVVILNDNVQEGEESFNIETSTLRFDVVGLDGKVTWSKGISETAVGVISDDERPTVYINNQEVDEAHSAAGANYRFQVMLSHQIRISNFVKFSAEDGTATEGEDYTIETKEDINFDMSCTNCFPGPVYSVLVDITDDQISEKLMETVKFTLDSATVPITVAATSGTAMLSIKDDDDATVAIVGAEGKEDGGVMKFVVQLSHEVDADVDFTYQTKNGVGRGNPPYVGHAYGTENGGPLKDGTQPDFMAIARTEDMWTSGGDRTKDVLVTIMDDTEQECDETFTVVLSAPTVKCTDTFGCSAQYRVQNDGTGAGVGSLIDDNENVKLTIADFAGPEGLGIFQFEAMLSHAIDREGTLIWSTKLGTADQSRFTAVTDGTQKFPPHADATTGLKQNLRVSVNDDTVAQTNDETFSVVADAFNYPNTITPVDCMFTGDLPTATGTIQDDENPTLSVEPFSADEDADWKIKVVMSHDLSSDVVVDWSKTLDGNAVDADFNNAGTGGQVTFKGGLGQKQIQFVTVDVKVDGLVEIDETFTLDLRGFGPKQSSLCTIHNIDTGIVAITSDPEQESNDFVFTMTLDKDVDVSFGVEYGAVTGPQDVEGIKKLVTFNGDKDEAVKGTVLVIRDNTVEPSESFKVNLAVVDNKGRPITFDTADDGFFWGTITNDDIATISVADISGTENSGQFSFKVAISHSVDTIVTVDFATTDGNAESGKDYQSTSGTVTFDANSAPRTETIPVTIIDDNLCELNKVFNFELSNLQNNGRAVRFPGNTDKAIATGTIVDNDAAELSLQPATARAGTPVDFTFTMSRVCEYDVKFEIASADVTAQAGTNYNAVPDGQVVTINRNSLTGSFGVNTIDHRPTTNDVTFEMKIIKETSAGQIQITTPMQLGTITPGVKTVVGFSVSRVEGTEGGAVIFTVQSTETLPEDVSFRFVTTDGSATAPRWYTPVDQRFTIAANTNSVQISVALPMVDGYSYPMDFTATISEPSVDVGLDRTVSTGVRLDSTTAYFRLTPDSKTAVVEGTPFVLTYVLTTTLEGTTRATMNVQTGDVTARAGVNYDTTQAQWVMSASGETFTLTIPTSVDASDADFVLNLLGGFTEETGIQTDLSMKLKILDNKNTAIIPKAQACPAPITRASGFSNTEASLSLIAWPQLLGTQTVDLTNCFLDPDDDTVVYVVASVTGLTTSISGSTLTIRGTTADTSTVYNLVITANDGQATATITLAVTVNRYEEYTSISDLTRDGQQIRVGDQFQASISRLFSDNCQGCTNNGIGKTDCCLQGEGNSASVGICELTTSVAARQNRLVSVRTQINGEMPGKKEVCYGTPGTVTDKKWCVVYETVAPVHVLPVPDQVTMAGTEIRIPMHVIGGTPIDNRNAYAYSTHVFGVATEANVEQAGNGHDLVIKTSQAAGSGKVFVYVADKWYNMKVMVNVNTFAGDCA